MPEEEFILFRNFNNYEIMRTIFLLLILGALPLILHAQNEYERWEKSDLFLSGDAKTVQIDTSARSGISGIKLLQKFYKFFISDHDGDNCPFYPSCSSFAVESVEKYGLIVGSLMFADRFMRDANIFNREEYTLRKNGRLYDPPEFYFLEKH